jgi:hypothetical protein
VHLGGRRPGRCDQENESCVTVCAHLDVIDVDVIFLKVFENDSACFVITDSATCRYALS